jgi:hypothetical protein
VKGRVKLGFAFAALLVAVLVIGHAIGLRDHVSVLSGTAPPDGHASAGLGVFYALAWFGAWILAPIVVLAAALHLALDRIAAARVKASDAPPSASP